MTDTENRTYSLADAKGEITNYIYLYHLDQFVLLPVTPETVSDSMGAQFTPTSVLGRPVPLYAYSSSGPRTVQFNLNLRRDLMSQINYKNSTLNLDKLKQEIDDDYVDVLVKQLQAIAVPKYEASEKMINAPKVAVRLGNTIYIHGIVNGDIGISYGLPILTDNKYAQISINFSVTEIDPYDATTIANDGSFRGISETLERSLYSAVT